jgi:hypothetical protein
VASRSPQEVEAFRAEKQMRVQGTDVPKPVLTFDEAGFPSMCTIYDITLLSSLADFFQAM